MEEPIFDIPINEPKAEFTKHLEPDYNKRIIFSAPFGTGKTYFLDKFFEDRSEKVIRLYPVNYSVSSNEDVFELIKFDILLQLLEDENLKLEANSFSNFFTSQFFLLKHSDKFVEWVLGKFSKVGKSIVEFAQAIEKLVDEYEKFKKDMETNTDESVAYNFLLNLKAQKGSAYEEDAITQLIQSFLQQLCGDERQCVLIIDDLDRIDPEHIFRLLNVFAAHFDVVKSDTNKFGFDKVIFVCDVNNIRNIFHAKYGAETDFTGYIDKFYSTDIFGFSNLNRIINELTKSILYKFYGGNFNHQTNFNHLQGSQSFKQMFKSVILGLLSSNSLNMRALLKVYKSGIEPKFYILKFKFFNEDVSNSNSYIIVIFDILKSIYGDYYSVHNALRKTSRFSNVILSSVAYFDYQTKDEPRLFFAHALPILTIDHDFDTEEGNKTLRYTNESIGFVVKMSADLNQYHFSKIMHCSIKELNWIVEENKRIQHKSEAGNYNLFKLLLEVFEKLQSLGHLKD